MARDKGYRLEDACLSIQEELRADHLGQASKGMVEALGGDSMTKQESAGIEFFRWFEGQDDTWRERPWLVLGKGPSFALRDGIDTSGFRTFGLNHVVLEARVDVAHAIDIDVVGHCSGVLQAHAAYLLMPWIPHVSNKPGARSLQEWIEVIPVLEEMAAQGRLLWYNKHGSRPHGDSPTVPVVNFSAEAPYALLGKAGVRTIRSLGIDGGNCYAPEFRELPTLLANGQVSFESQFRQIARSISAYALDAAPLNAPGPARVYVAATEEQALPVRVLEFSIRKHSSVSVQVMPLYEFEVSMPTPRDPLNRPRTPFSFQRFLIPEVAGYAGRAIYLDSDMQVMADIRELWACDMGEASLLSVAPARGSNRLPQYSVMVLDCGRLDWRLHEIVRSLDDGKYSYEQLMQEMVIVPSQAARIDPLWNSLERYVPGETKLVHYTDMDTQPWVFAMHPFGDVWVRELIEAVSSGFISMEEVDLHIAKGWVRPSLRYQVENGIADAMLLPSRILSLDRSFLAPFRSLGGPRGQRSLLGYSGALARHMFKSANSMARRIKRKLVRNGNAPEER